MERWKAPFAAALAAALALLPACSRTNTDAPADVAARQRIRMADYFFDVGAQKLRGAYAQPGEARELLDSAVAYRPEAGRPEWRRRVDSLLADYYRREAERVAAGQKKNRRAKEMEHALLDSARVYESRMGESRADNAPANERHAAQ